MVLGWKRPGRVGRRRIQPQCGLPLAAALFTSKSSREATRFLSLFEAILSSHLPANCTGQRRNLLTVCHRLHLLPRFSHRNRVEKRLDFFLCSKQYFLPIIPQIVPDSGAICLRYATVCACCRAFHIEIESRSDSISFFVRSATLFPSPRKLHRLAAQFALFLQFFRLDTLFSNKKVSHF